MPLQSKEQAFREYKAGTLHSGRGGSVVTDPKQAQAIALSVERRKKKSGMKGKDAANALSHGGY